MGYVLINAITMLIGVLLGAWLTQRTAEGKSILPELPQKLHKILPPKYDELMDDD